MMIYVLMVLNILALATFVNALRNENILAQFLRMIFLYPLVTTFFVYSSGISFGIIEANMQEYVHVLPQACFGLILAYFAIDVIIRVNKIRFYNKELRLILWSSGHLQFLLLALLFIVSVLAFPMAFFITDETARFNLISGASTLFVVLLVLLLSSDTKRITRRSILILLLFLLIRGERADILPAILFLIITEKSAHGYLEFKSRALKFYITLSLLFVLAVGAFVYRSGLDLSGLLFQFIFQNTIVDVVHVYLTGFIFVESNGFSLGPLYNIIESIIPGMGGVTDSNNFTELLQGTIANPGGGLAITAFYLSLGYVGIILYCYFYSRLFVLKTESRKINTIIFVLAFVMSLRINWYGLTYIVRPLEVLLFLAVLYMLVRLAGPRTGTAGMNQSMHPG